MRKLFEGSNKGERIDGSRRDDLIFGFGGDDKLIGHRGDDMIYGGNGKDVIFGGQDHDILKGGEGPDRFGFNSLLSADSDDIFDFKPGSDRIVLDHAVFNEYTLLGAIDADTFVTGTEALDSNDHLIFNPDKHKLFYDEDGDGAGDPVLLANLKNKADLSADDVFIF